MATVPNGNITQKWARNGGFDSFGTAAAYAGFALDGKGSNYVTCVRVVMPGAGISAQIKIAYRFDSGTDSSKKMRYKIGKSPADGTYEQAGASVAGDGDMAIVSGSGVFTVNYSGSFAKGEALYVYLWTGSDTGTHTLVTVSGTGSHTCTYTEGTASSLSVSGQYLGSPVTIRITRNNSGFTHRLTYSFAGHTGEIASGVETSHTWTPALSVFGPFIPDAVSAVCTVTCVTFMGNTQVGSAVSAQVTLSVPQSCVPEVKTGWIASVTAENSGTAASFVNGFVQGYSRAKVTFDTGKITWAYGAKMASLQVICMGKTVTASGGMAVTGTVTQAGTLTLRCICVDSRGRSAEESVNVTVMEYGKPSLSGVTVFRADSAGNAHEEGAWIFAKAEVAFSSLGGANSCSLRGYWKQAGGVFDGGTGMQSGTGVLLGGTFSATATYTVKITAEDALGNTVSTEWVIPTASCAFHIREGGRGAAFFGYSEKDGELSLSGKRISNLGAPQVNGDAVPKGSLLDLLYPVNSIYLSYGHTSPAELFGGTWTRIENRFLWAVDGKGSIGATGGVSTHTLTVNEMPSHYHDGITTDGLLNTHRMIYANAMAPASGNGAYWSIQQTTTLGSSGARTVPAGGGAAHNNMPPYIQISVWRRTA